MRIGNRGQVLLDFRRGAPRPARDRRVGHRRGVHVHRSPRAPAVHRRGGPRRGLRLLRRKLVRRRHPRPRGRQGARLRLEGQGGSRGALPGRRDFGRLPLGREGPRRRHPQRPPVLLPDLPRADEDHHRLLGRRGVRGGHQRERAETVGDPLPVGGHERERPVRPGRDGPQGLPGRRRRHVALLLPRDTGDPEDRHAEELPQEPERPPFPAAGVRALLRPRSRRHRGLRLPGHDRERQQYPGHRRRRDQPRAGKQGGPHAPGDERTDRRGQEL